jgi:hypothetical protein
MSALKTRYSAAIEVAIAKAQFSRDLGTVEAFDGAEVYAYPHREGIAWDFPRFIKRFFGFPSRD